MASVLALTPREDALASSHAEAAGRAALQCEDSPEVGIMNLGQVFRARLDLGLSRSAAEAEATAGVAAGAQAEAADVDSRPEHAPDEGARMAADDDEDGDAGSAPEEQEDPLEDPEDWVAAVADALFASNRPAEVADIHVEEGGGWSDEADSDQDCVVWVPFFHH